MAGWLDEEARPQDAVRVGAECGCKTSSGRVSERETRSVLTQVSGEQCLVIRVDTAHFPIFPPDGQSDYQ